MYNTYKKCLACGGTGIYVYKQNDSQGNPIEITQDPCIVCSGVGYIETGKIDGAEDISWIKKKIKKILQKLEIPDEE